MFRGQLNAYKLCKLINNFSTKVNFRISGLFLEYCYIFFYFFEMSTSLYFYYSTHWYSNCLYKYKEISQKGVKCSIFKEKGPLNIQLILVFLRIFSRIFWIRISRISKNGINILQIFLLEFFIWSNCSCLLLSAEKSMDFEKNPKIQWNFS